MTTPSPKGTGAAASGPQQPSAGGKLTGYFVLTAVIAAVGGLLFGFDTGVISGAILFIKRAFSLESGTEEFVTSAVLIGATLGALLGGVTASRLGRRWSIILAAALFMVGTLAAAVSPDVPILIVARVVVGLAIGVASFTVPMYIAEMSPARYRGAMTSLNQVAVVTGILLAYLVDYVFSSDSNWRAMFAVGLIPSGLLLIGMLLMPSSPRWLISKGRVDKAREVLVRTRGTKNVEPEIQETQESMKEEASGGYAALRQPLLRLPLIIGIGLAILQQVTGINTVIYYAPTIFQMADFGSASASIAATAGVGAVNLVATIVAAFLVDRVGRRPLLLTSLAGMTFSLTLLAVAFFLRDDKSREGFLGILTLRGDLSGEGDLLGIITIAGLTLYVASFAIGMGPIFWLLIAEIYPLNVRGPAMSLAAVANWASNWLVAVTFLTLVDVLTAGGTFLLFAAIGVLAWIFVWRLVFETKGKTLEQIEAEFARREHLKATSPPAKS